MQKKMVVAVGMALALSAGSTMAQDRTESSVTCADLNWSAEVLAVNPDIAQTCQSVYEKDGELYAKAVIEVVRVRGNRMTFRTVHTDGTMGDSRSVQLDSSWRADIGGRSYRASDLMRGQQLNVYLPEDRFALAVHDEDGPDAADMVVIEEEVVEMPTTASPLFLIGAAGGALLALGGALTGLRRRS
ncbi:hypothetical protein BST95_10930 [Halioglobus japonicus]|uniref:LPXTG cell wall anchor domain-containing protein n=1 Tax=Halioglobus japonicus TaxID=930805 RepID=A0AAP8SP25_9GAMM|nr:MULTISPECIES: hypothetical protein [Halioglobus]AQA18674.1 hypothetical protein BST95_10930 [Halioglobus japonicus]KZX60126.1 hypothetical protein A3709_12540 [Halioglobus sp. HI00S01]PLW86703.1 hypothetical protein C0029_09945 [Halioglobus japonicus]GHD11507.1 hypothetical protein GCM10007052_11320 [Halioglobus japonicus]